LLRAKLGTYKDFHTLLYTCSPEFDFLPVGYFKKITETLLLPTVAVVLLAVVVHWLIAVFKMCSKSEVSKTDNKQVVGKPADKTKPQVKIELIHFLCNKYNL